MASPHLVRIPPAPSSPAKPHTLDSLLDSIACLIAAKISDRQPAPAPGLSPSPAPCPAPSPASRLLTVPQAAAYLGYSPRHVHRLLSTGSLPRVGSGRSLRIDRRDLDSYIDFLKHKSL